MNRLQKGIRVAAIALLAGGAYIGIPFPRHGSNAVRQPSSVAGLEQITTSSRPQDHQSGTANPQYSSPVTKPNLTAIFPP